MEHSHPGPDRTSEETVTYFLSTLRKELISKVVRNKQTKNPNIEQNRSVPIWWKHEKQPYHMACGQQPWWSAVKNTTCNARSKTVSEVKIIYIGNGSEKDTIKLKICLVFQS